MMCNAGSQCNSAMLTFDGVDVMGERLAEEVRYGLAIRMTNFFVSIIDSDHSLLIFFTDQMLSLIQVLRLIFS